MNKNQKIVFISWTKNARHSDLLGKAIGAEVFFIDNFINSRGIIWKLFFPFDYLSKSFRTFKIIWKYKPEFVFVQNPPSFTPIVVVFYSKLLNFKVIVDSHNGAFQKPWVSIPLHKWALERAELVIVHNTQLYNNLRSIHMFNNVKFRILNSKLSEFTGVKINEDNDPYILVITSFAGDEPVFEMMEGIRLFNANNKSNIKFKITGNFHKNPELFQKFSKDINVEFLGFINDDEYNSLLINAYGAMALSTRNDVQQFALMEAIGATIPFISSKNSTNESLFNDNMVLTENKAFNISEAIEIFVRSRDHFYENVIAIKKRQDVKWNRDFNQVKSFLGISD